MSDDVKDKLNKPLDLNVKTTAEGLTQFGVKPSIHSRIANAAKVREQQAAAQAKIGGTKFINFGRIFIFPDASGSMDGAAVETERNYNRSNGNFETKITLLKKAVDSYLQNCTASINLVGVASFPEGAFASPTGDYNSIRRMVNELAAGGSTPMAEALGYCMETEQFTHGVLISDGCPDNQQEVISLAEQYKTKRITMDAVHIGSDRSGEDLMKRVAEITGGAYIKFTDVSAFAKAFQYLSPAKRGFLQAHNNPVALLGAYEVKL